MRQAFTIVLLVSAALLTGGVSAHAAARIEPATLDIRTVPGEHPAFTLQLVNATGQRLSYYSLVGEFDPSTGTVRIPDSPNKAREFISADLEFDRGMTVIKPRETLTFDGTINVSARLPEGTYHAVIAFVTEDYGSGESGIRLDPAAPRLLLNVEVQREKTEHLNLMTFDPLRKVFVGFPAMLTARINNGGNMPLETAITIRFRGGADGGQGDWAAELSREEPIDAGETTVVPVSWDGDGGFGRYQALMTVSYGAAGIAQTATASFWVLPLWVLVVLGLLLIVLSYGAARVIVRFSHRHSHDA